MEWPGPGCTLLPPEETERRRRRRCPPRSAAFEYALAALASATLRVIYTVSPHASCVCLRGGGGLVLFLNRCSVMWDSISDLRQNLVYKILGNVLDNIYSTFLVACGNLDIKVADTEL